ncbi:MAG: hypothetical protein R6V75_09340 [Bacteroidales bacterium]
MIPALFLIYYNSAANWHFHLLKNGTLIEHSHPYSKPSGPNQPFSNHNHSASDLLYLDMISQVLVLVLAAICLARLVRQFNLIPLALNLPGIVTAGYSQLHNGRAPPRPSIQADHPTG